MGGGLVAIALWYYLPDLIEVLREIRDAIRERE